MKSSLGKYDVMFVEMVSMYECYMPLAERLNIPVIGTVSIRYWLHTDWDLGIPYNPAVVPHEFSYYANTRVFLNRLRNLWYYVVTQAFNYFVVRGRLQKFYDQHYPNSSLGKKKPSLLFQNTHPSFQSRSLPPYAIEIAGIHIKPIQPLPQVRIKVFQKNDSGFIVA